MKVDNSQPPPTDVLVTLVHGTWGRYRLPFSKPAWFSPESEFVERLTASLGSLGLSPRIDAFYWSGANSIFARSNAAKKLARRIERHAERFPNVLHVVIGHSHGGTVCLLGLHSLRPEFKPIVVTLATPFMEIISTASRVKRLFGRESAFMIAPLLVLLWSFLSGVFQLVDTSSHFRPDETIHLARADWSIHVTWLVFVLTLNFLPIVLGNAPIEKPGGAAAEFAWLRGSDDRRPEVYEAETRGGATVNSDRKLLVVRGVDDEAQLVLAAGSIGTRLVSIGMLISLRFAQFLCAAFVVALIVHAYESLFTELPQARQFILSQLSKPFMPYVAFGLAILFCSVPIVSGLFKCVYGRELVLGGYFCEIKSASAPDSESVTTITLPPGYRGMRHGIYRHEMVATTIASYVHDQIDISLGR